MTNLLRQYQNGELDEDGLLGADAFRGSRRTALIRQQNRTKPVGNGAQASVAHSQVAEGETDEVHSTALRAEAVPAEHVVGMRSSEIAAAIRSACAGLAVITDDIAAALGLPETFLGLEITSDTLVERISAEVRADSPQIYLAYSAAIGG